MTAMKGAACGYRWAVIALILLTVFVSVARPVVGGAGHLHARGLSRSVLLSEPALDYDLPLTPPVRIDLHRLVPMLAALLIALKMRRSGFAPIPVRRLKLPVSTKSLSLPSH
jgi:hypothetical protein